MRYSCGFHTGCGAFRLEKIPDEGGVVRVQETVGEVILENALLSGTAVLKGIVLPEIFARRNVIPMLEIMYKIVSYFQSAKSSVLHLIADYEKGDLDMF